MDCKEFWVHEEKKEKETKVNEDILVLKERRVERGRLGYKEEKE